MMNNEEEIYQAVEILEAQLSKIQDETFSQAHIEQLQKELRPIYNKLSEFTFNVSQHMQSFLQSEEFQELSRFVQQLPKELRDSRVYHEAMALENKPNIRYEEVEWIPKHFGLNNLHVVKMNLQNQVYEENSLEHYLTRIILSDRMAKREKLIVLLAHIESLIYEAIGHTRAKRESVRTVSSQQVKATDPFDLKSYYTIIVFAIAHVIFANNDNFTVIDKRLPFRNNILHRGIMEYSSNDIDSAYAYLCECITILLIIIGYEKNTEFQQIAYSIDE